MKKFDDFWKCILPNKIINKLILRNFRKILSMSISDIFPVYIHKTVSIGSLMLVQEAKRVEEFVKWPSKSVAAWSKTFFGEKRKF